VEGIYNHILKNVLYFVGVGEETIIHKFYGFYEPGIVEMPNDVFFELTGVAQGFLAISIAVHLVRFNRNLLMDYLKMNTTSRQTVSEKTVYQKGMMPAWIQAPA
jgi:hypothetical protein